MEMCYYWDKGYGVRLNLTINDPTPELLADRLEQFFKMLWPVTQPLDIHLHVIYAETVVPYEATDDAPALEGWSLREEPGPSGVDYEKRYDGEGLQHITVPELALPVLSSWLDRALMQEPTSSNVMAVPDTLRVDCARTRIISIEPNANTTEFEVSDNPNGLPHVSLPIERRSDGVWVAAPNSQANSLYPAITLTVQFSYGVLSALVSIHWSWWFTPGTSEFVVLQHSLRRFVSSGWAYRPSEDQDHHDLFELATTPLPM